MLHHLSLAELSHKLSKKEISPVELTRHYLNRIEKHNPAINAFVLIRAEEALKEAKASEERQLKGERLSVLDGIPLTMKDSFDLAGQPTYCGSLYRKSHRAAFDATAVARLKRAGAILLGKTNCPEFLMNYETDNHIIGRTSNPWDLSKTPGGSSGGESAAIAAGLSAGGLGSDGGGSVRIPAHFTGIASLKPTPGRVSAAGHFPEICHPGGLLGVAGPMARTAEDVALLFQETAGYDLEDPFSAPVPIRQLEVQPRIVGLVETVNQLPIHPSIRRAVKEAARLLQDLGFQVEPVQWEQLEVAPELWWFFFGRLNAPLIRSVVGPDEEKAHWTGVELMHLAEREPPPTLDDVLKQLARRDKLRASLLRRMERVPLLLLPPCAVPAFPHRQRLWQLEGKELGLLDIMKPVVLFNIYSLPAVVLPFGFDDDGIPVGIQIAGRPYEEEWLLKVAIELEKARGPFPSCPMATQS